MNLKMTKPSISNESMPIVPFGKLDNLSGFSLDSAGKWHGVPYLVLVSSGEIRKVVSFKRYKSLRPDPDGPMPEHIGELIETLDIVVYGRMPKGIIDYSKPDSELTQNL